MVILVILIGLSTNQRETIIRTIVILSKSHMRDLEEDRISHGREQRFIIKD
jgi:hypothetical protein